MPGVYHRVDERRVITHLRWKESLRLIRVAEEVFVRQVVAPDLAALLVCVDQRQYRMILPGP